MQSRWRKTFRCWLILTIASVLLAAGPHVISAAAAEPLADAANLGQTLDSWISAKGSWRVKGDVYAQTETVPDCRAFAGNADWDDYVYEVKARKTGGAEGFLVLFRVVDHEHFYWWNVGGWGNVRHYLWRELRGLHGRV